jgi:hypothetical protein
VDNLLVAMCDGAEVGWIVLDFVGVMFWDVCLAWRNRCERVTYFLQLHVHISLESSEHETSGYLAPSAEALQSC